jgi:hypothetical protein
MVFFLRLSAGLEKIGRPWQSRRISELEATEVKRVLET